MNKFLLVTLLLFLSLCTLLLSNTPPVPTPTDTLFVGTKNFDKCVFKDINGEPAGALIDMWKEIAVSEGWYCKYVWGDNVPELIRNMKENKVRVTVSSLTINEERLDKFIFSLPLMNAPLCLLVKAKELNMLESFWFMISDPRPLAKIKLLIYYIMFSGTLFLIAERKNPMLSAKLFTVFGKYDDFFLIKLASMYFDCNYFALVVSSSTGFGDIAPRTFWGKVVVMFSILFGFFIFGQYTGVVGSLQMEVSKSSISSLQDIKNYHKLITIKNSHCADRLQKRGFSSEQIVLVDNIQAGQELFSTSDENHILVYDKPPLVTYAQSHSGCLVTGDFENQYYAITFHSDDYELLKKVNKRLVQLNRSGEQQNILKKHFGQIF